MYRYRCRYACIDLYVYVYICIRNMCTHALSRETHMEEHMPMWRVMLHTYKVVISRWSFLGGHLQGFAGRMPLKWPPRNDHLANGKSHVTHIQGVCQGHTPCNILQHPAAHYNTLQHIAILYDTQQHTAIRMPMCMCDRDRCRCVYIDFNVCVYISVCTKRPDASSREMYE